MKLLITITFCILGCVVLKAQEKEPIPSIEKLFVTSIPRVEKPVVMPKLEKLEILISSPSERARKLTWSGFSFLHSGWDLEAFRYFTEALREDENCLMAHAGYVLSLASPFNHEHIDQRKAGVLRTLSLVETKKEGVFIFPAKERGFALAVCLLITNGREAGAAAFDELAVEYPKDIQIPLMAAAFSRQGYDVLGKPRIGEEKALKKIQSIYETNKDHPLAAQYLINMYVDAPVDYLELEEKILPVARKLGSLNDVITWKFWLGIIEYRCGNLKEAEVAFNQCVHTLQQWKTDHQISNADADHLWKSYSYLAMVQFERGNREGALKIAKMFLSLAIEEDRFRSVGSQIILWEGYSLGARIAIEDGYGDALLADKLFPKKELLEPLIGKSAAIFYYDYLAVYLGIRKAVKAQDSKAVDELYERLQKLKALLDEAKLSAVKTPESTWFNRYFKHAIVLQTLSLNAGDASLALETISLRQAVDQVGEGSRRLPPLFFKPIEIRLSKMLVKSKKKDDAEAILKKSVNSRPSATATWEALGEIVDKDSADEITKFLKEHR